MVLASVRNLDKTKTLPAAYLNVADMLNHAGLLMTEEAVRVAEGLWGQKERANGVAEGGATPLGDDRRRESRTPLRRARSPPRRLSRHAKRR